MKNNNNENIVSTIMYIIIAIVLLTIIFIVFTSNKDLLNNKITDINNTVTDDNITNEDLEQTDDKKINQNESNNTEIDTRDDKSDINISKEKLEDIKSSSKVPKESQIATYTTTLYDKEQTRIENINLAISKLNGVIIENGSEFSFNNTIGPMDENNGFKKATGFDSNGKKIKISGGGICQISSTLYNSALIAGFEITERHPHSRRVYYVPKDKDATIFFGSLDLKFINNSGAKVKIEALATESTVTINLIKIT